MLIFCYGTSVSWIITFIQPITMGKVDFNLFYDKQTLEKTKGQSKKNNPETLATLDTQDTGRRQAKDKKEKNTEN